MNFILLGAAGYIAPKHLRAIKDTGNNLIAAIDPHDSVGVLDQYFPRAQFYEDLSQFKFDKGQIDYASICVPNYMHYRYIIQLLALGINVICEKPLVVDPTHLDHIEELEIKYNKTVSSVLQLRLHPVFQELKKNIDGDKHKVELEYITPRGPWYNKSWKGDQYKSGGLAMNVGVHFFDMLIWIFGNVQNVKVTYSSLIKIGGTLELERAAVKWFLSTDITDIPESTRAKGQSAHRMIVIDGREIEFTEGFADLHTKIYQQILSGNGYRVKDVRQSIELIHKLYQ